MKRTFVGLFALAACIGLSGCNSVPKADSDDSMFDYMQAKVGEIGDEGGMAALGMGSSRKPDVAVAKAKLDARKSLAQLVQVKIENLEKAFVEEVGDADSSEINELFSSATKQITSQTLQGTLPKIQKYETDGGVTTAYVLMVLNPDVIHESLKNNAAKHLYERFRASKAFDELDKEIAEFEAAESQGTLGM
ncbi:MAG: LPP20 family lipoprotein [Pontiellaceae bacterium]|nr:LPP20 family lipoprotein [Pontiellaceae bacterium]MBN2784581.1 LPP20 family lipoprotein [Pontiellaceae bacterium]